MSNIWLIIIFLIPIVLIVLFKVNAVMVYLGLCLGYVLSQFDGGTKIANKLAGSSKIIEQLGGSSDVRLIMLVLPAIVILLFLFKTASSSKLSINLIPAIATGLLTVITVIPLLPINTAVKIMTGSLWHDVTKYEGNIIALSTLTIVIMLIINRSKINLTSKESKHHKS
jgi:hypothetical protein